MIYHLNDYILDIIGLIIEFFYIRNQEGVFCQITKLNIIKNKPNIKLNWIFQLNIFDQIKVNFNRFFLQWWLQDKEIYNSFTSFSSLIEIRIQQWDEPPPTSITLPYHSTPPPFFFTCNTNNKWWYYNIGQKSNFFYWTYIVGGVFHTASSLIRQSSTVWSENCQQFGHITVNSLLKQLSTVCSDNSCYVCCCFCYVWVVYLL